MIDTIFLGADIQKDGIHLSDGKHYWKPSKKRNVLFDTESLSKVIEEIIQNNLPEQEKK